MCRLGAFRIQLNWLRYLLIGWAVVAAAAACGPRTRPGVAPFPAYRAAADDLFQRAERSYGLKAYEEALALFGDYMARYPEEPLAPAALMKIGAIHSLQGNGLRAPAEHRGRDGPSAHRYLRRSRVAGPHSVRPVRRLNMWSQPRRLQWLPFPKTQLFYTRPFLWMAKINPSFPGKHSLPFPGLAECRFLAYMIRT